jgi:3-hydroxyacyl-[acyl-carrier-protein] dehydratase
MTPGDPRLLRALERLPHGLEFRFLDRLLELDPGVHGAAEYRVPEDAVFLRGHFPGDPLMPGVLVIEAAAQLAGVVAQSDPHVAPLADLKLASVRNAKILGAARPRDRLRIEARVAGRVGGLVQADALVWIDSRLILTTELVLAGAEASRMAPQP